MNPVVIQVVGVLVILFFFFVLFMCSKTWRWPHVLFTFLTFAAAIACAAYFSLSLKTNLAWKRIHGVWVERVAAQKKRYLEYQHGDLHEVVQTKDCIRSKREELLRIRQDRGRVWRGCQKIGEINAQGVMLQVLQPQAVPAAPAEPADPTAAPAAPAGAFGDPAPAADPAAAPAAPAAPAGPAREIGIADKSVVYAFTEREHPEGFRVPDVYIGEFRASDVDNAAGTLRLSPLIALDTLQGQAALQNTTWVLYEILPLDGHEIFSDKDPDDNNLYGEMREEVLRELLPDRLQFKKTHDELVATFVNDGRKLQVALEAMPWVTKSPETTMVKTEFVTKHAVEVDSDAAEGVSAIGFFDPLGRTVAPSLRRSKPVEFQKGDTGVFTEPVADRLVADGVCKPEVERYYSRKLIDFEFVYHDSLRRYARLLDDIELAQRNFAQVKVTRDNAEAQVLLREQEKAKLVTDLKFVSYERDQIVQHEAAVRAKAVALRSKLGEVYGHCKLLAAELTKRQMALQAQINQRAPAAESSATLP